MRFQEIQEAVGRITKQNQTADVGPQEIKTQAAKFGNTVDKDGRPPTLSKKTKGSKTNVLFNLGLTESSNHELYQEAVGEIADNTEIFVDMDGVLADFFSAWANLMGVDDWRDINKKHNIDDALEKIRQTDDFWINLPLTSNAKQLLGLIKQVKGSYKILSSPLPGDKNSEPHKRLWVEKHLGFFPPEEVIIEHNKAMYATQADGTPNILIDDYGVNISQWEAAGGIGFKHKDHKFERTAKNIKQKIDQPIEEKWSKKYKSSINCNNPKGFSQKAHCAGKKKNEDREIGIHRSSEDFAVIDLSKSADGTFWLNGVDNTDWDTTVTTGQGVDMAFEISSKARLASYNDIDKYSTGELENMGYDGVRIIDGDNVSYQIWNTDILKRTKLGENFADGKKKGKSRPGRAKRAGVDCSKSITALRKQAKNSSGEKQKMAHWCANMKSGKK